MEANECLKISVTLEPTAKISSALYARGKAVANRTFAETDCTQPWVTTLQAIAGATRLEDGPDFQPRLHHAFSPHTPDTNLAFSTSGNEHGESDFTYVGNHSSDWRGPIQSPDTRPQRNCNTTVDNTIDTVLPWGASTGLQDVPSHLYSFDRAGVTPACAPAWSSLAHVEGLARSVAPFASQQKSVEEDTLTGDQFPAVVPLSSVISLPSGETMGTQGREVVSRESTPHELFQSLNPTAHTSITSSSNQANEAGIDMEVEGLGSGSDTLARTLDISTRGSPMPSSPTLSQNADKRRLTSNKRMKKLLLLVDSIRDYVIPSQQDHNEKVDKLYSSYVCSLGPEPTSMEQFGQMLGRLGNLSNTLAVVYGLLSWEIFRREEERLVREERQPSNIAAKRMNDRMASLLNRRTKARDWASDGRRAAGMIFGAISAMSTAGKSSALLLLADLVTLDGLLKIAHFPALREHFVTAFVHIQGSRREEWEGLAMEGYQVFDYEEFLQRHTYPQSLTSSASSPSPLAIPELSSSAVSLSPGSQPTDCHSRWSREYNSVLGKRLREVAHVHPSATLNGFQLSDASPKENNISVAQMNSGSTGFTAPGVYYDHRSTFASPQTQDFLTLFQHSMNHDDNGQDNVWMP